MDLEQILSRYPELELADELANKEILKFFDAMAMRVEGMQINYDRKPNFFGFLNDQAEQSRVILGRSQDGELKGVGSFHMRKGYLNEVLANVGYLGDLRVGLDRRILKSWRKVYGEILDSNASAESTHPRYFLTAVLDDNLAAKRALVTAKNQQFVYDHLVDYQIVQIIGKKPWASRKRRTSFEVRRARASEVQEIIDFLQKESQRQVMGYDYATELPRRLNQWENFSPENFILVKDHDKVIACTALWEPTHKKIVVENFSWSNRVLFHMLNRSFLAKRPLDMQTGRLNIVYLTHLTISQELTPEMRRDVFRDLFVQAYQYSRDIHNFHALSFHDYAFDHYASCLKDFVSFRMNASLYTVRHRDAPQLQHESLENRGVGFEMALV